MNKNKGNNSSFTEQLISITRWFMLVFLASNIVWGLVLWSLHNKMYEPTISGVSIEQSGEKNNQNISK